MHWDGQNLMGLGLGGSSKSHVLTKEIVYVSSSNTLYIGDNTVLSISLPNNDRSLSFFNDSFIANSLLSVPVKGFWKSVNIWQRYRQEYSVTFFGLTMSLTVLHQSTQSSQNTRTQYLITKIPTATRKHSERSNLRRGFPCFIYVFYSNCNNNI